MPIPFIIAGAALLAGGYGIKKGLDAKRDFDEAEQTNERARSIYDDASSDLQSARRSAQQSIEQLGKLKFTLYQQRLLPFVESFSRVKNIHFSDPKLGEQLARLPVTREDLNAIQTSALSMKEVVNGGVSALGAGGLAGLAAYGGVGALASTAGGTAIAGLSGAAASNATLAWLGGGALSAGGFGIAGGTAVLGGIVAGPVLAVGGMLLASKAEEAKHDAYSNLSQANQAAEQMRSARVATKAIQQRFDEVHSVLSELDRYFEPAVTEIQALVSRTNDYNKMSKQQQHTLMLAFSLAKSVKTLLETPLLKSDGSLAAEASSLLSHAQHELQALAATA